VATYPFFTKSGRRSVIFGDVRREEMQLMYCNCRGTRSETIAGTSRRGAQNGYMIRDGLR
jgi:hypothetical protein